MSHITIWNKRKATTNTYTHLTEDEAQAIAELVASGTSHLVAQAKTEDLRDRKES